MTEEQETKEYLKMCQDNFESGYFYSVSEEGVFYKDPEEVALNHFNYDGYDGQTVQVYQGISYIPTNTDEIEWMVGEGHTCLIKCVKPYVIYRYDRLNDRVIEVQG